MKESKTHSGQKRIEPRVEIVNEVTRLRPLEKEHKSGTRSPKRETVILPDFPGDAVEY